MKGEQLLRLLLWGSLIHPGERVTVDKEAVSSDEADVVATLVSQGKLTETQRLNLAALERALLEANGGDIDEAIKALGGWQRANALIDSPGSDEPPTAPMVSPPRFANASGEDIDLVETRGRYTHISEHGSGGMGRVLIVHDKQMGRDIALKELLPDSEFEGATDDSPVRRTTAMASRFLQEGLLTAALEHPAIVPVYEVGRRENGTLYYTMKLVRGKTFGKRIRECENIKQRLGLLSNFVSLCQAIAYSHERGVIHRDIKPANVMIGDFGETVVLDWGIAKLRDGKDEDERETLANFRAKLITEHGAQAATELGQAVGTPGYMAPEQALGNTKLVDERSDVFALGIMLYEILCGERAFDGKNMSTLLDQTVRVTPKPLGKRDSAIPPELISICERAINKDPRHRYQSVKTMIRDLESFQTGALVASHEYSWTTLLARTYKKHRTLVLAGAASTAVIAAVAAYSYVSIWQARDNERAQRVRAEGAEGEAKANLVVAEEQRDLAETERARAEEESWLASTRLLHRALQDGEFATVHAMLDKVPEERRGWEWRYAKHASSRETLILSQPGERPHNLEFNDARTRALVQYDNRRARVWDILGRKPLFESPALPDRLNVGVLLDDGATVALGYAHGVVIVHEVGSGAELGRASLGGHPCGALAAMSNDELIIGAEDGRVLRWAWRTGQEPELITQLSGRIDGLHLSPKRQLVCAWHGDEILTLFPSAGGNAIAEFPGRMAGFSPDGALYASDHAGRCEVRNTSDGTIAWATDPAGDQFHSGSTDARGNLVARGGNNRAVAFDMATGRQIFALSGEVTVDAAISTDGRYFIALNDKGFVSWTDLETGALIDRAGGHEGRAGFLLALEEGNAATVDGIGNVRFWSPERAVQTSAQWIADVDRFYIQGLAGAKNGIVAVTQQDDDVSLMNSVTGRPIGKLASQSLGNPRPTELSEDGALLVTSPDAFSLASVPTDFSAPPTLYLGSTGLIASIAISADATTIANTDNHGRVNYYKVGDPKPIGQVQCGEDYLPGADFLPDGSLLVGSATGVLYHLGTNPPTLLKTVEASKSPVRKITCSSVSNLVAIGYANGEIELRDAKTLDSVSTTKASAGEITKLFFSASGDRLFSNSDENISLWLLTSDRSLEESGLYWNQAHSDLALSGPNEDLWCCTLGRPLSVYRTSAPEAQAQADPGSFTIATLVTPERLAEIGARLDELVPDWRAQLSSGNPIPEGPLAISLSDLGLKTGTKLNATSPAGSLEAFLDLLGPNAPCGNAIPWSGGNRSGHSFKGLVSVVCAEQQEVSIDLTDEECKQLQSGFLGALQFYGTGLSTQLQMRTEDWLGWPPAEDTVQLWLPDMSVSPLKPWLTKL